MQGGCEGRATEKLPPIHADHPEDVVGCRLATVPERDKAAGASARIVGLVAGRLRSFSRS
jgi:hypothetical protein